MAEPDAVRQAYDELDGILREFAEHAEQADALYERRRAAFKRLLDLGEAQAAVARHCGLSPMAVAFAVKGGRGAKPRAS